MKLSGKEPCLYVCMEQSKTEGKLECVVVSYSIRTCQQRAKVAAGESEDAHIIWRTPEDPKKDDALLIAEIGEHFVYRIFSPNNGFED